MLKIICINIWCGGAFLNEKNALEMVAKYSPKNVNEFKLSYKGKLQSELASEELESFFISWANRLPQNSLSLIVSSGSGSLAKHKKIIDKYIKLGIIKKFVKVPLLLL